MINPLFATIGSIFLLVSALGCGSETASTQVRTMEVTVLFPADEQKYNEMITGEQDFKRAAELLFVKKKVVVPYSTDLIAQALTQPQKNWDPVKLGRPSLVT